MGTKLPLVSICCTTYNHEKYIRDAIEGFLMQKTTFPVEILIHDDASTDKTAQIVKEYAENHSDLIITIFQTENQYSQGIKPWPNFVFPRARGKYIALCEGDDYWTDPLKLQKQVDFLEEYTEYNICFHNVKVYIENENRFVTD
jgi:glycosyltransferase involved in cell wall biosynthesis